MIKRFGLSTLAVSMTLVSMTVPAVADPTEEALLPIERKISTFTIRVTKTGYEHFASAEKAPVGSAPAQIIAISGRNSKDIWMLTETGVVLQDDGKSIKFRQAKPCGWGEYNREVNGVGTHLYNIVVDDNDVHVFGQYRDMNTRIGAERRATLSRNGKWTCSSKSLVPELTHASGALTWRAAYNMDGDACRVGSSAGHCTSGPRFAPTHVDPTRDSTDMGIHNLAMWMFGPDDGYVVTLDETFEPALYRFNGIAWTKQVGYDNGFRVSSMWGDERHDIWLLTVAEILRYDGKTTTTLPRPSSFDAARVLGHSSKDVWFGGGSDMIYQWDGSRFRQAKLSGEVADMWVSSDDVAFFVLPDAIAFAAPNTETH